MSADRYSFQKSFDSVQSRHVGAGHSDLTKFEWSVLQQRDTLASHLGHADFTAFVAIAQNDSIGRVRYQLFEKLLQPCGPPPARAEEEEE